MLEDAGAQTVPGFASSISKGVSNANAQDREDGQTLRFNISTSNDNAFAVGPAIDAVTGDLTYTIADDWNGGPVTVTVTLSDDGGTDRGGVDASAAQTFTIAVTPVNDEPSFTVGQDQTVLEDSGLNTVPGFITAINVGPADEQAGGANAQTPTFTLTTDNDDAFSVAPTIDASGNLSYTLNEHWNGTVNVTVVMSDSGDTTNGGDNQAAPQTFVINVASVNDAPNFINNGGLSSIDSITEIPSGSTINELFDHLFEDPFDHQSNDGSHDFAGVAITGNRANPDTEGSWEYSTDGGATWYEVGDVSTENALLLEHTQTVKLRFMPVYTFTGEPGQLEVHAVDDSTTTVWTQDGSQVHYDTTTDDHRDHVSVAEVDLTTSTTGKIHVITHFFDSHSTDRHVTEPSAESPASLPEPAAHEVTGETTEQIAPAELVTPHDESAVNEDHHDRTAQSINERYRSNLLTGSDSTAMDSRRDSSAEPAAAAWADTVSDWADRQLSELEEEEQQQTREPATGENAPVKPIKPEKELPADNKNDQGEDNPEDKAEEVEAEDISTASGLSRQLAEEAESETQSLSQLVEALEALKNESNSTNRRL